MAPGRPAALLACALALQLLAAPAPVLAVPRATVAADFASADLAAAARGVASGGQLTISGLVLEGEAQPATLELRRRDVWAPGAKVVVHSSRGDAEEHAPPASHFFHGVIAGQPHSTVALAVQEDGSVTGIASAADSSYVLGVESGEGGTGGGPHRSLLTARRATLEAPQRKGRRCGNKGSTVPPGRNHTWQELAESTRRLQAATVLDQPLQATLAIDSDAEFYGLFGNQQAAINYVTMLVGYADLVYSREVGVDIRLGHLELRPDAKAPGYPSAYLKENVIKARDGLMAVMRYWNNNRVNVPRTTVMYLSGQRNVQDVGMAWEGVLCEWYQTRSENWAYGFISNLKGDFRWNGNQANNPIAVTWDPYNFAHELGHNFGSSHTHDFCGNKAWGDPNPIDYCIPTDNDCEQPWVGVLPQCTGPVTAFGGGPGTIMGYCDEIGPGFIKNVAMTLGLNHPCGNKPERVVTAMRAEVQQKQRAYPACFAPQPAAEPAVFVSNKAANAAANTSAGAGPPSGAAARWAHAALALWAAALLALLCM